jgi:hypothetical protein
MWKPTERFFIIKEGCGIGVCNNCADEDLREVFHETTDEITSLLDSKLSEKGTN